MREIAEQAIKNLMEKAGKSVESHEAMHYAQAAQNLANAFACWKVNTTGKA